MKRGHRETSRHLEAFECFYGLNRDYPQASAKLGIPFGTLRTWGDWFGWHARADKRDREAAALAEREAVKRKAAMLIRHRQSAELVGRRGVEFFAKREIERASDAITAIKVGIDLERQAEGMPDWVGEILNADEDQLRKRKTALQARLLATTGDDRDSPGDALAASNGCHEPELAAMVPRDANGKTG